MTSLRFDLSMSLDGFITGPNPSPAAYTSVTDGIEAALEQARMAAGTGDVMVAGGANIVQQYLGAGLVDEFQIHLVPVLMGGGVRLFDEVRGQQIAFHATRAIVSPSGVVHLGFADASRGDRPMVIS